MKIKLDENIPTRLVTILSNLGHDVDTVQQENLKGYPDPKIWDEAQKANRFFITQDLDFSDVRRFIPGTHHGILLLRLREPGRNALVNRVQLLFEKEDTSFWNSCFIVVSEHKVRVKRPLKASRPTL